jgi:hypothetical protein
MIQPLRAKPASAAASLAPVDFRTMRTARMRSFASPGTTSAGGGVVFRAFHRAV